MCRAAGPDRTTARLRCCRARLCWRLGPLPCSPLSTVSGPGYLAAGKGGLLAAGPGCDATQARRCVGQWRGREKDKCAWTGTEAGHCWGAGAGQGRWASCRWRGQAMSNWVSPCNPNMGPSPATAIQLHAFERPPARDLHAFFFFSAWGLLKFVQVLGVLCVRALVARC